MGQSAFGKNGQGDSISGGGTFGYRKENTLRTAILLDFIALEYDGSVSANEWVIFGGLSMRARP